MIHSLNKGNILKLTSDEEGWTSVTFTKHNYPREWYKGAAVCEWAFAGAGCEPNGLWGVSLPYESQEQVDLIHSLNKGDILELTSAEEGWTREYDIQCLGIDIADHIKYFYIVKKGGVAH